MILINTWMVLLFIGFLGMISKALSFTGSDLFRPPMVPAAPGTLNWVKTSPFQIPLSPQTPISFTSQSFSNGISYNDTTLVVNTSVMLQPIIGFGGALTESSASVFAKLSPDAQNRLMEAYYGDTGHRYTMARTHIGSCDFALNAYTYQDTKDDFAMKSFNMSRDYQLLIPFIKRAKAKVNSHKRNFRLVSSPWTPPDWLKVCQQLYCAVSCGLRKEEDDAPYRSAYALYLSKYLDEMDTAGIKPWAITPQNEPQACKPLMESTTFTAANERDFISQQLGPMLKHNHMDVKLLAYDHNKDNIVKWSNTILSDANASGYVDGMAFHWYSSHDYFEHLEEVHKDFPNTILLATEATEEKDTGHYAKNQSWEKGEHYGHVIMGDLNHWSQGWIDWNILLDMRGGPTHPGPEQCEGVIECGDDAMIIANTVFKNKTVGVNEFYPQIFYWYMGHFSRYVLPGSHRVGLINPMDKTGNGGDSKGNPDGSLEAFSAITNDEQIVVVVMNRNEKDIFFTLVDDATGRSTKQLSIQAHSIHTYWYPK